MSSDRIPEATVARLPVYHRALGQLSADGTETVSSGRLAELTGVTAAAVRKDLSHLGSYGTRGVGYDVRYLLHSIHESLGLRQDWPVVIVGVGNLGQALVHYRGFAERGFTIVGLFDSDPEKVGTDAYGLPIQPMDDVAEAVVGHPDVIGVIATPAAAAQQVADLLVSAGVVSLMNFAPALISVPDGVVVRKVDLALEMQVLTFYAQRRDAEAAPRTAGGSAP
ncbi:MAG: redox-sensing transcriptional repressor Rex [Actinomycetota bacterium]